MLKLVIDVHYHGDDFAVASGILFKRWESDVIERTVDVKIDEIAAYESGSFYKRELPCIQALLNSVEEDITTIIIDGFVVLGEEERDGLGGHLYRAIDGAVPVIGVAKNSFKGTSEKTQVLRGESQNPLYVTAVGVALDEAKACISAMHGKYRVPTLLKQVDTQCREALQSFI